MPGLSLDACREAVMSRLNSSCASDPQQCPEVLNTFVAVRCP